MSRRSKAKRSHAEQRFDRMNWAEVRDLHGVASEGGRQVLGWALAILALLWTGYTAWSAGRALADQPLTSPQIAQWVAILAGPLALMGLVWLMFGRTRRKEAERFTRSVVTMRTEARSLQDVLGALSQQIAENHRTLGVMAGDLMGLGDQAASRLGAITARPQRGLANPGRAWRGAGPRRRGGADRHRRAADRPAPGGGKRRPHGRDAARRRPLGNRAGRPASKPRSTSSPPRPSRPTRSSTRRRERLLANLTQIESAGAAAAASVSEAGTATRNIVDALLARSAEALTEIRTGIDAQAAAVSALVAQSQAGIGRAGIEASELLGERLASAGAALDGLTRPDRRAGTRLAAADRRPRHGPRGARRAVPRPCPLGDERANHVQTALDRLRIGAGRPVRHHLVAGPKPRRPCRAHPAAARGRRRAGPGAAAGEMARPWARPRPAPRGCWLRPKPRGPHVEQMRDAAIEAENRIESGASNVEPQQERLAALMTSVDLGVGQAEQRLTELSAAIAAASEEAGRLSAETGPALVAALVQVREAAAHAAERAREAIAKVIPESAGDLSEATRAALEKAVRDSVETKLAELDQVATEPSRPPARRRTA